MVIGERVRMADWDERTSGKARYVADVDIPGCSTARILRSPHAHAVIQGIDVSRAASMAGVVAVVTAADFGDVTYHHHGGPLSDRHPLAKSRVRFVGEEVAAVAAETSAQAEAALAAIDVVYRTLPVVDTVDAALKPDAPRLHDRVSGTNVSLSSERKYGDLPPLPPGGVEVAETYRFARQAQACMETNGTLARWNPDEGRLHIWVSTQSPYFVRKELAHVLGLSLEQVVSHEVAVGGGFGSKSKIGEHEAIAAKLAIKSGRPVRLILDREEEFAATKGRHEFHVTLTSRATADGKLLGHDAAIIVDNGAYNHSGPSVMGTGVGMLASLYPSLGVRIRAELVDTNKTPGGQFRGYGAPQVTFAVESQMDELADALGIDPIDLRLQNMLQAGEVTHAGLRVSTTGLAECLEAVRQELDWDTKRQHGGSGHGVGIAISMHASGARTYPDANRSRARVKVESDGTVTVAFGGSDPGTGQRGLLAQTAAHELGVALDQISVRMMDSDEAPFDMGAWSSRGTVMGVGAVQRTAQSAAAELRRRAADKLGTTPDRVRLEDGSAIAGEERVEIGDLVRLANDAGDILDVEDEFVADVDEVDRATGVANISLAYSFAAHGVEVEVDPGTGRIRVLNYVAAHDSGTVMNRTGAEGQIVGGVVMGIGAALSEELLYEGGRTVNPDYLHYAMPRAADVPRIRPILIEHADPQTPYGVKAVGEISLNPVAPAIANAVAHATGRRIRDLPLTPDKVLGHPADTGFQRTRRYSLWRRPGRWWISAMRWAYPRGAHGLLELTGARWGRQPATRAIERVDRPTDVDQAITALADKPGARPLGGGTDLLPACGQGLVSPSVLVDCTSVVGMAHIGESDNDVDIGGAATLTDTAEIAPGLGLPLLAETIRFIASPQIRQVATVAGNLCQEKRCWFFRNGFDCYKRSGPASPCYAVMGDHRFHHAVIDGHRCQAVTPSDLATAFVALDAVLHVRGRSGPRQLSMMGLYTGPGETSLRDDELITSVRVPNWARGSGQAFEKLSLWQGDFAVASAAACVRMGADGRLQDVRAVLGGMAPIPWRAVDTERALIGKRPSPGEIDHAARAWTGHAHPLPRNEWKIEAASSLLARALSRAAGVEEKAA